MYLIKLYWGDGSYSTYSCSKEDTWKLYWMFKEYAKNSLYAEYEMRMVVIDSSGYRVDPREGIHLPRTDKEIVIRGRN